MGFAAAAEDASEANEDMTEVATAEAEANPEESAPVAEVSTEEMPLGTDIWGAGAAAAKLLPSRAIDAEIMLIASIVRRVYEEL